MERSCLENKKISFILSEDKLLKRAKSTAKPARLATEKTIAAAIYPISGTMIESPRIIIKRVTNPERIMIFYIFNPSK